MKFTVILGREGYGFDDIYIEGAEAEDARAAVKEVREMAYQADQGEEADPRNCNLKLKYPLIAIFVGDLTPELDGRDDA